ncbi:MAG: hypothetical protein WBY84_20690, partial [Pseudolabrys sp.]
FACELMHTSKAFHSMVCNRLEVICHEDLDTSAAPHVFPFVTASLAQSRERYSKSIGEARLMVGNAIRMMARAPKSRAGCHFAAAIGLRSMLEGFAPTIPDYALDMHTMKGKAMGRGLDHFRKEGAKLVPPPTADVIPTRTKPTGCGRSSSAASKPKQPSCEQPPHTIAKASKLEPSSTRLAAISVRNPSETKS